MTTKDITDAWARIRKIDNTIPDEVLDFMKDAAIEKLNSGNTVYVAQSEDNANKDFNVFQHWQETDEEKYRNLSGTIKHFQ